jgi:hypothetical protein
MLSRISRAFACCPCLLSLQNALHQQNVCQHRGRVQTLLQSKDGCTRKLPFKDD